MAALMVIRQPILSAGRECLQDAAMTRFFLMKWLRRRPSSKSRNRCDVQPIGWLLVIAAASSASMPTLSQANAA
jgi:hypothetical protein